MVAGFQEDLDSDDEVSPFRSSISYPNNTAAAPTTGYDMELSSDNEDAGAILTKDIDVSDEEQSPAFTNHRQSPPATVTVPTPDWTLGTHSANFSKATADRKSDSDSLKSPVQIMTSDSEDEQQEVVSPVATTDRYT